jgi:D-aminopeptidase
MYEPWSSGEKLNFTAKEITVQYVPQTRAERLVKIPTVKSVAGTDLTVVSSSAKNIYRKIEQDQKQEAIRKRDEW